MMRKLFFYMVLLGIAVVTVSSCGGSKSSSNMRKFEKHSRRNAMEVDKDGNHIPVDIQQARSKQVQQALDKQQKREEAFEKEVQKTYRDDITRHREMQTPEVRARMDQNLKAANKRYSAKKEFFVIRWFRPKDDIAKIEKRQAKEAAKRMAATRKKAEKTNEQLGITATKTIKTQKVKLPDPKDAPQGGGGTYKNINARSYVNPANIQHGGGGSYNNKKSGVNPSDIQHGGGGTYKEPKTKKKLFSKKR